MKDSGRRNMGKINGKNIKPPEEKKKKTFPDIPTLRTEKLERGLSYVSACQLTRVMIIIILLGDLLLILNFLFLYFIFMYFFIFN